MSTLLAPFRWLSRFGFFHSLRFRLTVLVLLGSLPALGLLLYTANQQRDDALAEGQETATRLVRLAAADQRRVFDQARQLLATFSRLPEIEGDSPEACERLVDELLEGNPEIANLGVVNRDGSVFCTGTERDLSIVLNDREFVEDAFASDNVVIGTYQIGPLSDEPTVSFAVEVPGDEDPERIVFASLDIGALDTFANIANLPEGTVFSVYDRSGVLLFRSPQEPEATGRSFADAPAVQSLLNDPSGAALTGIDDPEYIYAGETINIQSRQGEMVNAGFITVAVPKAAVIARADESFEDNLSRLGLAALVAVALAWVGADLFMSRDSETRKSLVADIYRVYESGDLRRLDDIVAMDVVDRSPAPGQVQGLSGYKQLVSQFRSAFPNGKIVPDDILADGDMVVARVTLSGTQVGEFFGIPPTNKPVAAKGVETFRFANGVVVEMWSLFTPLVMIKRPQDQPVAVEAEPEPERSTLLQRMAAFFRRRPMR